jgi:hypothetical protein
MKFGKVCLARKSSFPSRGLDCRDICVQCLGLFQYIDLSVWQSLTFILTFNYLLVFITAMCEDHVYLQSPITSPLGLLPSVTSLLHYFIFPPRPGAEVHVCLLLFSPEPSIPLDDPSSMSPPGPSAATTPPTYIPSFLFSTLSHFPHTLKVMKNPN